MPRNRGFSLIELLIVVAIILIIAAIAIPNMLRARMAANESSAVNSIRQIKTAEVAYFNSYPTVGYAPALPNLGCGGVCPVPPTSTQAGLIDDALTTAGVGTAGKSGYVFAAVGIAPAGTLHSEFVAGGTPLASGKTGTRDFCATADGALRYQPATGAVPQATVAGCEAFPSVVQ